MANNKMMRGVLDFQADFSGPLISTTIGFKCLCALGTGTNSITRLSINGGACRLLGDTNEAADMVLSGPLSYELDKCGLLTLQTRIRVNTSVTHAAVFVGFQDIVTTGQMSNENASVVSTPADAFGIFFDEPTESTLTGWGTIGVGNDVDDTVHVSTNIDAPVVATWVTVKIEADSHNGSNGTDTGVVRYRSWVDGKLLRTSATDTQGWMTSKCRSTVVLAPVIARAGRGTAYSVDVAEFNAFGNIGDAFD